MFIVLLTSLVNASSKTKCESLSNQKCEVQPTLINLYPNKYNQDLMEENIIQIKSGITINVNVSVKIWKNILCLKNVIFGILLYVIVKMVII